MLPSGDTTTAGCLSGGVTATRRLPEHAGLFHSSSRLSNVLRYGRFVACFNLYPSCQRDLDINQLLWAVAKSGEYDPAVGNVILENNILGLAYPAAFHRFLASVSLEELAVCMLEVLAMIAEGEDAEGLSLMKQELEPSVWDDLVSYMKSKDATELQDSSASLSHERQRVSPGESTTDNGDGGGVAGNRGGARHEGGNDEGDGNDVGGGGDGDGGGGSSSGNTNGAGDSDDSTDVLRRLQREQKTIRDVEMLLRFCYLSPWKIEVYASFITPRDMAHILSDLSTAAAAAAAAAVAAAAAGTGSAGASASSSAAASASTGGAARCERLAARTLPLPLGGEVTADRPLVRSAARRPVWAVRRYSNGKAALDNRLSNKKLAFWRQFQTWRIYRRALVDGADVPPAVATDVMLAAMAKGSVDDALARAETVMACACVQGSPLSALPKDVVYRYIAPYVLLNG